MFRIIAVYGLLAFLGLIAQSSLNHSFPSTVVVPDFLLILVVFIGLRVHSFWGLAAVFALGLAGDFASGQFVGPCAAGAVVAFNVSALISRKVYAETPVALVFLTFLCSIVKSGVFLLMLYLYANLDVFGSAWYKTLLEALLTAIIAPAVVKLVVWGAHRTSTTHYRKKDSFGLSLSAR